MEIDEIRSAVLATVASLTPESDLRAIRADQPLRAQIELDSMDWLNLIAGLHERLNVDIPESAVARLETLDSIVAYVVSRLADASAQARHAPTDRGSARHPTRHRVDGTEVTVRPIGAGDAPLEADFVRRLSDESRYTRFMGTLRELPEPKLRYLTDVDNVHHVALAATVDRDGRELLVGAARYVVDPTGTGCEFAVEVDDAWQGSGVAGVLMQALIEIARTRGLKRMEAIILSTNRKMLRFARQLGFGLQRDAEDPGTIRAVRLL
jgi:GNAT superfamily N-acetyltransferase/acyl carrier protein